MIIAVTLAPIHRDPALKWPVQADVANQVSPTVCKSRSAFQLLPFVKHLCLGFFFPLHFLATFSKQKLVLLCSAPIYNVSRSFLFISMTWQAFIVSPSLHISLLFDLLLLLGDLGKCCIRANVAGVPGHVLLDTAETAWGGYDGVHTSTIWIKRLDQISIERTSGVRGVVCQGNIRLIKDGGK